jgi:6-phosphofructokinase 1
MAKKRIAVLTSGGDAPGMNPAVRAVVRMAISKGCEAFCVHEGYEGLVLGGDLIKRAEWDDVRGYLVLGGTKIGSARCAAFRERPGRLAAAKNLVMRGIDALIVCGGDGSLTGADIFRKEWPSLLEELVKTGQLAAETAAQHKHLNIVGLVGSIDNDLSSTDATIGCFTSLTRICDAVDCIVDTAESHQRAFIVEVMGRHCGWLALMAAISTGADFVFIPESPPEGDWRKELSNVVTRHREIGKRHTTVIVAEGAIDRALNKIPCHAIHDHLSKELGLDTRVTTLGHLQRGGSPCFYDRMLGTLQGAEAVSAVLAATRSSESPVIAIIENKIVQQSLKEAVALTLRVPEAIRAQDFDLAMRLRDSEFTEYYNSYRITTALHQPELLLPKDKRLRIGIIHVGAPAGGMNSATRAAVAYCEARGHTPVALYNGFSGIIRHHSDKPLGAVREISWLAADEWVSKGGSEIGTNRTLPSENMKEVAFVFSKYNIQALFIIGGFEAFAALSELRKARDEYEEMKMPMVLLPATISNNVPGTEYSLGSDTCLNYLTEYCDTLRQSASSSRRRVFVVETQGGESGYIATLAGLSVGALAVYTPEEGISLNMIAKDFNCLKVTFERDRGQNQAGAFHRCVDAANRLREADPAQREVVQDVHDADHCRHHPRGVQGQVRGAHWSARPLPAGQAAIRPVGFFPMQLTANFQSDRLRALRFAVKSMQHIETYAGMSGDDIAADPMSCAVIGVRGARVSFSPMLQVEATETDWKHRRPKNEFWMSLSGLSDTLAGRPRDTAVRDVEVCPV